MVDYNNFTEWHTVYEKADEETRAAMRIERKEHQEKAEAEHRAKIDQAVERLGNIDVYDLVGRESGGTVARDIRLVLRGFEGHKHENQILQRGKQLLHSQLGMLVSLISRQPERMGITDSFERIIAALDHLGTTVQFLFAHQLSREVRWVEALSRKSTPNDVRQRAKDSLAAVGIHLTESGEMIVDEPGRLLRLEEECFPEAEI